MYVGIKLLRVLALAACLQPMHYLPTYFYLRNKVKIINPLKKSIVVVRQLHEFHSRFESAVGLRAKLIEYFKEQVPDSTFEAGFYEGQKHSKVWICSNEDLKCMYPSGEITLWCEGRIDDTHGSTKT